MRVPRHVYIAETVASCATTTTRLNRSNTSHQAPRPRVSQNLRAQINLHEVRATVFVLDLHPQRTLRIPRQRLAPVPRDPPPPRAHHAGVARRIFCASYRAHASKSRRSAARSRHPRHLAPWLCCQVHDAWASLLKFLKFLYSVGLAGLASISRYARYVCESNEPASTQDRIHFEAYTEGNTRIDIMGQVMCPRVTRLLNQYSPGVAPMFVGCLFVKM